MTTLVNYPCPACGVLLQTENNAWQDWTRCPECETPARPPYVRPAFQAAAREPVMSNDDVLYIGLNSQAPSPPPASYVPAPAQPDVPDRTRPIDLFPGSQNGQARPNPVTLPPHLQTSPYEQNDFVPPAIGPQRIVLGGGFFFGVVLTLISLAQHNPSQAGFLAFVSFFLLILLARSSARG